MQKFTILPDSISEDAAVATIHKLDSSQPYIAERKIYYPYQFVSYQMKVKALLVKEGALGCTIDMISGRESVIDSKPSFERSVLDEAERLPAVLSKEKAEKKAVQFFQRHASKKYKFLTVPRFSLKESQLFFRPFWVVSSDQNRFIVDAVSGKFHPL